MEDQWGSSCPTTNSKLTCLTSQKNVLKVAYKPKTLVQESIGHTASKVPMVRGVAGDAALFLLKVAALETIRRFSRAKCPFAWRSLQVFHMLCYPPFKWVQRWDAFKDLVRCMQMLSQPLLILSIATAFCHKSDKASASDDYNVSHTSEDMDKESSSVQPYVGTRETIRISDEFPNCRSLENWLLKLHEELESQGISLPERINESEVRRFYSAADGDFSCLLSSIKKTIRWREAYRILPEQELKMWSNMVFWHGYDVRHRPCLIVRLGLACTSLPTHDRPRFSQAVVSQMEHGILHLADYENPMIMVLVDCEGLSPFRIPMHMLRSCSLLFQDHFPNCLGGLFVIRLPLVDEVMAQTFMKVLKPVTQQKLKFLWEKYKEVLSEYFQELPACIGGNCRCAICSSTSSHNTPRVTSMEAENDTQLVAHLFNGSDLTLDPLRSEIDVDQKFYQVLMLRTIMVVIILFVFIGCIVGILDPETRPKFIPMN